MDKKIIKKNRGFTLLVATVTTSMLLIVSFVVVNVAYRQLVISNSLEESHHAFYAAESGIECAYYWDLEDPSLSEFATSTAGSVTCNGQTVTTGSQTVPTTPTQPSLVGGGGANATSTFSINFGDGCAIVRVIKRANGDTVIDSRGYNRCGFGVIKKVERGVELLY